MQTDFFHARPMAANEVYRMTGARVFAFLSTGGALGTISITDADNTPILTNMPLAAGFNRISIMLNTSRGGTVTLAGGASGTLLI